MVKLGFCAIGVKRVYGTSGTCIWFLIGFISVNVFWIVDKWVRVSLVLTLNEFKRALYNFY